MNYPDFDRAKYQVWAWPRAVILHWVLNPGIAIGELLFGTRIPKVLLIDRTSTEPLAMRTYVPCPSCGKLQPGLLWSRTNGYGHWYGYICPTCEKIIPCLWNWASLVILAVTAPLWYSTSQLIKPHWLAYEKRRLEKILAGAPLRPNAPKMNFMLLVGVFGWGGLMWVFMTVIPFLYHWYTKTSTIVDLKQVIYSLPICLTGGLLWGLFMVFMMGRRGNASASKRQE